MSLIWIWLLIFILYIRTINYNFVIDDNVKRSGYLYEVPLTAPPPEFYNTKPSPWYRLFIIGMHCVNVSVIYLLWGWGPALIFAVHPMSVWGVAWVTGNYYATAAYFTLIAYYIIHTLPGVPGSLAAMCIYAAALNSTVCPITFPFLFLFIGQPWGLTMFIPLAIYLKGKKFTTGIKIRYNINNNKVLRDGLVKFSLIGRLALMTKLIAKYTSLYLLPDKIGFFDPYGSRIKEKPEAWNYYHAIDKNFWSSLLICLSVLLAGLLISPVGILWYFCFISLHSQFNLTGQYFAGRYTYLAGVGLCVVIGTLLQPHPVLMAVVATILTVRTHCFIPVWRNQKSLWANDLDVYPESAFVYNNYSQHFIQSSNLSAHDMNYLAYLLFKAESMEPNSWEIKMNLACLFAHMGQLEAALEKTNRAIEILEPLGGLPGPLNALKDQRVQLEKHINAHKESLAKKASGRAITSLPEKQQEGVKSYGTRTKENAGVLEPIGTPGS